MNHNPSGAAAVNQRPLVIYHGGCADGQGAAVAFYSKYPHAEFVAAAYGKDVPDVENRDVYMLDFSYPRGTVLAMCAEAKSITIIDHHKSAMLDLEPLNVGNLTKIFDITHSGAVLTWQWCWPNKPIPALLRYIEDRDLWRFTMELTKPVNAYLYSLPFELGEWGSLLDDSVLETALPNIRTQGEALLRQDTKRVSDLVKHSRLMCIAGHTVPAVNCAPYFASEAGHVLSRGQAFAACYYDTKEDRVFSLRSSHGGLDVSIIAKSLGGGGHASAAGFRVSFEQAQAFEIESQESK